MSDSQTLPTIAILAMPETGASVVFGMYDMFMSAGRDWGMIESGEPGASLLNAMIVSRLGGKHHGEQWRAYRIAPIVERMPATADRLRA